MNLAIDYTALWERWAADPLAFVEEALQAEPTDQQRQVLKEVRPGAHISIRSGHGVGKSAMLSWLILWFLCTRYEPRVPCTATSASQLRDVLWPEISKWLKKLPYELRDTLEWQTERIHNVEAPSDWFAVARTARKEKPEALQGFHSENLMFVVDEASGVPDEIFELAQGAMTKENVIVIMTGNPTRLSGEFYRSHHKDRHLWKTFHFSSDDSSLVSDGYAQRVAAKYGKDSDVYRVRVLGDFPLAEEDTFIPLPLVEAAHTANYKPSKQSIWAVDPARFGDDETALVKRRGKKVISVSGTRKRDTMAVAGWVASQAKKEKPDQIMVDVIGIGAGVADRLRELGLPVVDVNVANTAIDQEQYRKIRDEIWGNMREELIAGRLDLPDDEELLAQLSAPKYSFDSAGRIVLEKKEDMKKRGVDSPDRADALAMTFYQRDMFFPEFVT